MPEIALPIPIPAESAAADPLIDPPPAPLAYASPGPAEPAPLREKAIRSGSWTLLGFGASQCVRFGSTLVLSRLLVPKDFGLAAMVGILINGMQQFSDVGLAPAIIQSKRGDDPRFLNTAWTIGVIRGIALWLCACILAWPVAYKIYEIPLLFPLVVVASFNAVIGGLNSTSLYTLNRHMRLGRTTVLNITCQCFTTCIMIAIAWFKPSVWAIIIGGMGGNLLQLAVSHFLIRGYRNRFAWDAAATHELFKFGKWIFVSTLVTFFANEVDRLILGKIGWRMFTAEGKAMALLGLYTQAATLIRIPQEVISRLAGMTLFPALAQSAHLGPKELQNLVIRSRRLILPAGVAAVTGLALGAPLFVQTIYDPRYWGVGWITQYMAIGLWVTILQSSADRTLLALGKAKPLAISNAANMIATMSFSLLGFWAGRHCLGGIFPAAPWPLQGFILGVAMGNVTGYLVVLGALANSKIYLELQDIAYTALVVAVLMAGLFVPRLLATFVPVPRPYAVQIGWGVLLVSAVSAWAFARVYRWWRVGR